jgi:hypothetical protein
MSEDAASNSGDVKAPVENKPMSEKDFLSSRIAKLNAKAQPAEAKSESDPEEGQQKPEATSQEAEPKAKESSPKDVLSKDVDELTDEDIAELAQRGKSGLLKRIAELTAKRKLAEEKTAALEAAINTAKQRLPEPKVDNNPYANISNLKELQAKRKEVDEVVEWAEDIMFNSEDLSATDVAVTVDGKEYTKADIRESLKKARKARDKFIPAQFSELQAKDQRGQLETAFKQQARQELSWLENEDNDTRKRFQAMVNDPRLKAVKDAVPDIAPQIDYLIAHAANSMYGRKLIEDKPKSPSINPPSNPSTSASSSERTDSRMDKSLKEIESRFKQSGSSSDFIALRAAQISKRKN